MGISAQVVADAVRVEAEKNMIVQRFKRMAILGRTMLIPANGQKDVSIDITQSGDFYCKQFNCKIVPTNVTTFTGLTIEIWDNQKANLTDGAIPLETIASPGYGVSRLNPLPFEHTFERSGKIKITISNTSSEDQTVKFAFVGEMLA